MLAKELRVFASCLGLLGLVGCGAGNVALREARKAELRKDWDTALVNYEKAGRAQPETPRSSFTKGWFVSKPPHHTSSKGGVS